MFFRRATACIFCEVLKDPKTVIIAETSIVFVINDIRPAAKYHFLVIPKHHVDNAKVLTAEDLNLVKEMREVAQQLIDTKIDVGNRADVIQGCTWPPFNTVSHLHLHVISPASSIRGFSKYIIQTP